MIVTPVIGFGILFAFISAAGLSQILLEKLRKAQETPPPPSRDGRSLGARLSSLTDRQIDKLSVVSGVAFVIVLVLLTFFVPRPWLLTMWAALSILGIISVIAIHLPERIGKIRQAGPLRPQRPSSPPPRRRPEPTQSERYSGSQEPRKDDPYRALLAMAKYDQRIADNLIAEERKSFPTASLDDLCAHILRRIAPAHEGGSRYEGLGYRPAPASPPQANSANLERRLLQLTEAPIWNWGQFRGVLIALATLGAGRYVPASRRPDTVCLDGLQTPFTELRTLSRQRQGSETSRVVLVDTQRSCLVIGGKIHIGSDQRVTVDLSPEPGHEMAQVPIATIHVHPEQEGDYGLSDVDYISFLSDYRQFIMIVCIKGGQLIAMKTTATPATITSDTAQRLITATRDEILALLSSLRLSEATLAFNKAICTEFGMTVYRTTDVEGNVAVRIAVTSP